MEMGVRSRKALGERRTTTILFCMAARALAAALAAPARVMRGKQYGAAVVVAVAVSAASVYTAAAAAVHPDLLSSLAGPQHTAARVALGQKQARQQQAQPPPAGEVERAMQAPQLQGLVVNLDCGGLCNESTRR